MKLTILLLCAITFSVFADNNLTSKESKRICNRLNAESSESWTNGVFSFQFDHVMCPSDKSQCAFTVKLWPRDTETETLEGSYNGRGKGFYWSAKVLQRGLVSAKCTLKSLETLEDILTSNGSVRADVLERLEDCLERISKTASK